MSLSTGELVKLPEVAALTDMQLAFVMALIGGASPEEARDRAGYSKTCHPSMVSAGSTVQRAIAAAVSAELKGPMKLKAMRCLDSLLGDTAPAATRFNAAKLILEYGDDERGDDKPLSERSTGELNAMIEELELARMARMKDVTPGNGA